MRARAGPVGLGAPRGARHLAAGDSLSGERARASESQLGLRSNVICGASALREQAGPVGGDPVRAREHLMPPVGRAREAVEAAGVLERDRRGEGERQGLGHQPPGGRAEVDLQRVVVRGPQPRRDRAPAGRHVRHTLHVREVQLGRRRVDPGRKPRAMPLATSRAVTSRFTGAEKWTSERMVIVTRRLSLEISGVPSATSGSAPPPDRAGTCRACGPRHARSSFRRRR
jgi:hypothetical protein